MSQTAPRIGLTEKQVEESRAKHGANVLTPPEKTPLWKLFLEKFQDPIIRILLLALLASVGISCFEFSQGEAGLDAFFEPASRFCRLHAFQACLFNHSSTSPMGLI